MILNWFLTFRPYIPELKPNANALMSIDPSFIRDPIKKGQTYDTAQYKLKPIFIKMIAGKIQL